MRAAAELIIAIVLTALVVGAFAYAIYGAVILLAKYWKDQDESE